MTAEGHTGQTPGTGQYKAIVESITDPAYLLDSEQNIAYTNQLSLQYPAVSLEALRGGHVMDLIAQIVADDEDSAKFDRALEAVYHGDEDVEFPVTVKLDLDVSGGTTTREYRLSPCPTETGTGVLVVSGATTEHRGNRIDRQEQEPGIERTNTILRRLTETTDDIFWVFDSDYTEVQFVNDAYEDLWGRSVADLKEDPMEFMKGVHPDDRHIVRDAVEKTRNGEQTNKEYRVNPGEDFGRWVQVKGEPIYDDGDIICVAGIARDITERKEREQRLKKLQERLDLAVKGAEIGTWDWDIETDEVIFNDAWATMLGYTRDELDFHFDVWEELVHPADLEEVTAAVEANLTGKTDFWEDEIRMETKSGDWKWVWTIGRVVEQDEDGEPVRAAGIHVDIHDRKQAELGLKRSERQFDAVFNDPQMLVGVLNTEGVVQQVNQTAVDSVPATREQIEGTPFSETPWWNHDTAIQSDVEEWVARARTGEYVEFEAEHSLGDGERMIASGSFRPVRDADGEVVSVVASSRDITERREREREIREEKAFTDGILDSCPDVFYAFDAEANLVEYNERLCSVTGYEPEELETMGPWEFFPEDERELIMEAVGGVVETGETVHSLEAHYLTKSGEKIPYEFSGSPYYDGDGTVAGFVGFGRDISDRRERDRELQQKRERLRRLFDEAPDPMFVQDEVGKFTDVNEKAAEKLGYSRDELLEMEATDIDASVDRDDARELLSMVKSNGQTIEIEGRHQRADGSTFPVDVRVTPLETDNRFLSHARDITERKEREQKLERKQGFLEQTQDVADVGGWEVDLRTESLRWTEEVYRIHSLDSDFEPTVEAAIDLYHPEDQATIQDAVEMATTEGEPYDEEVRIVRPDGEVRWTRARGEPWYEDGDIVGVRGTFQDITERREREAQLKTSNERLEQFAYVASHDLQEPLRTISNYTEILAEDYAADLDEEAQRFIDVVVTGSERMQSMINGLLDYSRVTTRGGEFEPVDTGEVVADTTADLELMLDEHDGTVETGALPTVEADGDQLHQVFQNLVKNALEHSGEDPATIEIRGSEEPNQYRFEVEDDGPGIAKSRQEKIFRIFKSGEQYQTQSQAKGLGLAICDNIVRRHGGEIWVESEPDDGATFVFTIDKDKDSADPSSKKQ